MEKLTLGNDAAARTVFGVWPADHLATLVFCLRDSDILLIEKKRGLGAGKVNGPGGKLDPGETPDDCAVREVFEETGVRVHALDARGELRFRFADGYRLRVFVFVSTDFSGTPHATDEADPFWCARAEIPFARMWADDRLWLARVLDGGTVDGELAFDGDALGQYHLSYR